jgi:hypothetical protein
MVRSSGFLRVHLSHARVRGKVKAAACRIYMTDINVWPIVKAAARIRSRISLPNCCCASREQDRQTDNSQSTLNVIHQCLSVTPRVKPLRLCETSADASAAPYSR